MGFEVNGADGIYPGDGWQRIYLILFQGIPEHRIMRRIYTEITAAVLMVKLLMAGFFLLLTLIKKFIIILFLPEFWIIQGIFGFSMKMDQMALC